MDNHNPRWGVSSPDINSAQHVRRGKAAWAHFYGDAAALAVTLELYRKRLSPPSHRDVAREFFRALDFRLSGARFYRRPPALRSQGYLAPEDWKFHPHLHGILILPSAHQNLPNDQTGLVSDIWKNLYPGGSAKIDRLETPERWLAYTTKRSDMTGHDVSHAMDFWSDRWGQTK